MNHSPSQPNQERGFTLTEVLIALTISSLVITVTSLVFIRGIAHLTDIREDATLAAETLFITETLTASIRNARSVTVTNPTTAVIEYQDFSTETLSVAGQKLSLAGNQLSSTEVDLTALTLTGRGDTLQLAMTLATGHHGRTFSATTTIATR